MGHTIHIFLGYKKREMPFITTNDQLIVINEQEVNLDDKTSSSNSDYHYAAVFALRQISENLLMMVADAKQTTCGASNKEL